MTDFLEQKIIPTLHPEKFRNNYLIKGVNIACSSANFNFFHVHKVENSCVHMQFPLPPYRNTVHECILLTNGSMVRSFGMEHFTVNNGSAFLLPAGQISTFESASETIEGYYCHFSPAFLAKKYFNPGILEDLSFLRSAQNPVISLPEKGLSNLVHIFKRMEAELFQPGSEELLQGYLLTMLLELKQYHQPSEVRSISPAQHLTDRFKELITKHYKENKLVSEYAEILNISPNHLNKTVKTVTGKSPTYWIDELVMIEAKVLLHQSSLSISDISYELGIDDPSYFGRMFKKNTGIPPSEFRKHIVAGQM